MSNKFNWKDGVGTVLFVLLVAGGLINSAAAANTNSLDLERYSSQLISISDGSQTGLDFSTSLTMAGWVKFRSLPTGQNADGFMIIGKSNPSANQGAYQWEYQNISGTKELMFAWSDNGSGFGSKTQAYTFIPDTWYHIAVTFSGSGANNRIRFYVNGTQVGSDQAPNQTSIYNSNATFQIGGHNGTDFNQAYFDGTMDDMRAWNRELTSTEIGDLYTNPANFSNGSNLVGWWKLDNNYNDSSGNGNTLTPSNGPVFSSDVPFDSVPPPPPPATEDLSAYKNANESVTNSTSIQNDDELELILGANKVYAIEGVIFISSTKAKPDAKISFNTNPNATVMLGYLTNKDGGVLTDGSVSPRIVLPANAPVPVFIKGTVSTGTESTSLELLWAQSTSNSAATTVLKGSYLRATEL